MCSPLSVVKRMKKALYILLFFLLYCWNNPTYALAKGEDEVPPETFVEDEIIPPASELVTELPYRRNASAYGIDVSHYQGAIDWPNVRNYGPHPIQFMYAKASQGITIQDDCYVRNMEEARREGILVGSYHYFSSGGSGVDQCDYFMQTMEGIHQDLIPVVDVEECNKGWGPITLRRHLREFIDRMEQQYEIKPIIYTGVFFYNLYLSEEFKDCKFYIARYSDDEPLLNDGNDWTIWQFTDRGQVDGIRHNVDIDCINSRNSLDEILLSARAKGPNPRHKTKPHPKPNSLPVDAGIQ